MPRRKTFSEEEVLQKAIKLFWRKGYHATSMQDLIDELGINRASLYDTYGGKRQLFDRAIDTYQNSNFSYLVEFFKGEPQVKVGFQKLFEGKVKECIADKSRKGCLIVNTTTELIPGDSDWHAYATHKKQEMISVFADYIQSGIDNQQINVSKDPTVLAATLYTFYNGLNVIAKVETNAEELNQTIGVVLGALD